MEGTQCRRDVDCDPMIDTETIVFIGEATSAMPVGNSSQLRKKGKALLWLADQIEAVHKEQGHDVRAAVDSDS